LPPTARFVKLFSLGFTAKIKKDLYAALKEGREVKLFTTPHIHDRYIIRDNSEGRMIGTSFGGFGNKIFTVLPLPAEDVRHLVGLLHVIEQGGNPLEAKART
jgi:hypothetical protein